MIRLLTLTLALTLTLSCGVSKKVYQFDNTSVIRMNRGPCFGTCPFYDITIDGTGLAQFKGKRFVEKIGDFTKTFTPEETNLLFKRFEKANFWDFQDEYTAEVTDLPTIFITFEHKGRSKKIKCYYNTPEPLVELLTEVDRYANMEGWEEVKR